MGEFGAGGWGNNYVYFLSCCLEVIIFIFQPPYRTCVVEYSEKEISRENQSLL